MTVFILICMQSVNRFLDYDGSYGMASSDSGSKKKPPLPPPVAQGEFTSTSESATRTASEKTSIANFGAGSETRVTQRFVPILQITAGGEQGKIISLGDVA